MMVHVNKCYFVLIIIYIYIPVNDIIIGTTTYDLQSNSSVDNRLLSIVMEQFLRHGHIVTNIHLVFLIEEQVIIILMEHLWDTSPSSRIESSRGGWPSILTTGSGKEIIISHNNDSSTLQMTHRSQKGQ